MHIIDVHIHASSQPGFAQRAKAIGHEATPGYLDNLFRETGIERAVAMGSGRGGQHGGCELLAAGFETPSGDIALPPYIGYCVGVPSRALCKETMDQALASCESHLKSPACLGIKFYPGYNPMYPNDDLHQGFFELAEHHGVPVVFHTGDTANSRALVKYAHPLGVDEVAVAHPNLRIVMAHYGNPWIVDATEVAKKNPNVFIDLSALAQGCFDVDWFYDAYYGYIEHLRTWIAYLGDDGKLMYGSDFPLCNIPAYIELIARLIREDAHDAVFYQNALRVFSRLKSLAPLQSDPPSMP